MVFSVHDDSIPFLELWTEPTEVASKPPQFMFPLAVCQHISPSLVPAGDHEWTFVVNFETVAIRFSCNSRESMEEWVDCIRNKLGEMGILNPKGNLYSKVPGNPSPTKTRNPMSPLPQPPVINNNNNAENNNNNEPRTRTSIVDTSDSNQSFTTSIYLNQTTAANNSAVASAAAATAESNNSNQVTVTPLSVTSAATVSTVSTTTSSGATSSVYLNKSNPTRHVTRIPINKEQKNKNKSAENADQSDPSILSNKTEKPTEEPFYDAIPDVPLQEQQQSKPKVPNILKKRQQSPPKKQTSQPLPIPGGQAKDHSKEELLSRNNNAMSTKNSSENKPSQPQRIKKKSQRSSSLGPLLDEQMVLPLGSSLANTNSLESIDSNPRQKLPRGELLRERHHGRIKATGAIPRRPLTLSNSQDPSQIPMVNSTSPTHIGSPPRHQDSSRPPPYMAPPGPPMPGTHPPHPPHIPLPGLTCQLSLMLPQAAAAAAPPPPPPLGGPRGGPNPDPQLWSPTMREQQVYRLRQEIAHPAGVRLTLRKRDCQNSLALVEIFGCLWIAGWKQREYPILFNAFHIGDQILSVAGQPVRTASDFNKLVKSKAPSSGSATQAEVPHVEIIVRRLPFAQVYYLKREVDGQPLGLVLSGNTAEVREIVPGSPAAVRGMSARVRSLDGQTLVAWYISEVNGRALNLLAKDGEAASRLQNLSHDLSVLIQPSDFVAKLKKQLKAHKNYKDYLLT